MKSFAAVETVPVETVEGISALGAAGSRLSDYADLAKPRITGMVLITSLVGFLVGQRGPLEVVLLMQAIAGTALVTAGAQVLNQLIERRTDALMHRTRNRPLPGGRVQSWEALVYGLALSAAGLVALALWTNTLTVFLAAAALGSYLLIYTPLKKVSPLCTLVGAVPGAIPPVMGWTAARGELGAGALALFLILFIWQLPHFYAIAWMYRDDYARGGFPMLAVLDPDGSVTARHSVAWCLVLLPVSLIPTLAGETGIVYLVAAAALGIAYLVATVGLARHRSVAAARRVLLTSVVYLPVLLVLMLVDRISS